MLAFQQQLLALFSTDSMEFLRETYKYPVFCYWKLIVYIM